MRYVLKITINVIRRRIKDGEILAEILKDYPRLSVEEIEIIKKEV
ncbi:MAG: antitoxin [Oscillospiraceae bacterium]